MPITSSSPVVWTLETVQIDMTGGTCTVSMSSVSGGVALGNTAFTIPQADFLTLITANPTAGMTRQQDLLGALYGYAVAHGYANGTVS